MHPNLLDASCRVALAALLHDLGKFAERAGMDVDPQRLDAHLALYARPQPAGWYSHRHAAYTALAIEQLEDRLPSLVGEDAAPFSGDDSLINAAACHHRPETQMQWLIATADRVASGFERETFDQYNDSRETGKLNHITARLLTLFEQVRLQAERPPAELAWRYPLKPLAPKTLFPVPAAGYESTDQRQAQAEYRALWDGFIEALAQIPPDQRTRLDLWLDHFDTLWLTFTHAIPSATAFGAKPEVSLYDHSKAVAALAVALWRYHHERGDAPESVIRAQQKRSDWDEPKFLLIQGDLFGIQDFIFATGGETNRRAAKLLRGRSFYVSLLTECAALRIIEALSLPATSQIINAAGKFLIVAPNTASTQRQLEEIRRQFDAWFLEHTYGQSGIGLAWLSASCNDFANDPHAPVERRRFNTLVKRLFAQLEQVKAQRFGLCAQSAPSAVFVGYLDRFDNRLGVCQIDGRSPAIQEIEHNGRRIAIGRLAQDQMNLGNWLTRAERLVLSRQPILNQTLALDLFGYRIGLGDDKSLNGRRGQETATGNLRRLWDFSLPTDAQQPLWHGYARRAINAYIPHFTEQEINNPWFADKYGPADPDESAPYPGEPKTFGHLACEDRWLDERGRWVGICALMTLKGDVDNLGRIFQGGLENQTFAKMAGLSRQLHGFFAIYLPWLCLNEFPNTYTVFAGGDDFFLIGPWKSQLELAKRLRDEFRRYVAKNPELHFSAGLAITKPLIPVRQLARLGEAGLERAKASRPEKDSLSVFGQTLPWARFDALWQALAELQRIAKDYCLSTAYLYGLLDLIHKAEGVDERPENAIWYSQFVYRSMRFIERTLRGRDQQPERWRLMQQLVNTLLEEGIERFKGDYRIPLFIHLYHNRD